MVRPELHDVLHRVRPRCGGRRSAPHGRHRGFGPAGHHGAGAQRRPAGAERRHFQRAAIRTDLPADQCHRSVPAASTLATRSRCRPSSRCRSLPAWQRTRHAGATRSAATSGIRRSSGSRDSGQPEPGRGSVPGTTVAELGKSPDQYNPFGMAFAPDGTLYFVDIHIACTRSAHRLRPGLVRWTRHASDLQRRPTVGADGRGRRLRFPDQRDRVRPGADALSVPVRKIEAPLSGPAENPTPGQGSAVRRPGKSRLRLSSRWRKRRDAVEGAAPGGHRWPGLAAVLLAWCGSAVSSTAVAARSGGSFRGLRRSVGLAELRARRAAHLPRPDHADTVLGPQPAPGVVLPDGRRRDGDADGRGRHGVRRARGTTTSTR